MLEDSIWLSSLLLTIKRFQRILKMIKNIFIYLLISSLRTVIINNKLSIVVKVLLS